MKSDSALLVVDMQNDFYLPDSPFHMGDQLKSVVPSIRKLIDGARQKGCPIFYIVRGHDKHGTDIEKFRIGIFEKTKGFTITGTEGAKVIEELAPLPEDYIVEKARFSAFFATKLDLLLRRLGIKQLIISGMQYPNCIRSTAVDGISLDYDVIICTDATWGASDAVVKANIFDMENMGIRCLTLDDTLNAI